MYQARASYTCTIYRAGAACIFTDIVLTRRHTATEVFAMATSERRWTEERIESLITLLEERPCLYNTKIKSYFNRDIKKKALDDIAALLDITGKRSFFTLRAIILAYYQRGSLD